MLSKKKKKGMQNKCLINFIYTKFKTGKRKTSTNFNSYILIVNGWLL